MFPNTCRDCIFEFLKLDFSNKPSFHSRFWYQQLSLKDKLHLAQNIYTSVILNLLSLLHKNKDESKDASTQERCRQGEQSGPTNPQVYSTEVDISDESWDDRHLTQYTLYHQKAPLLYMPAGIMNSAYALNQFQEHTVGKHYQK
jgi:hypothetical protein